jgi:hypothetical protein
MAERGGKLRGALRRDPEYRNLPGKPDANRRNVKPSMGREGNMANVAMERLSPGVYRSAGGGLVTKGGRQIQRPTQAPPAQSLGTLPSSLVGANQLTPEQLNDFNNRYGNGAGARMGEIAGNVAVDQNNIPSNIFGNRVHFGTSAPPFGPGASMPQFDPNNPNSYQPYIGQIRNGLNQPMTMPQMPQASANNGGRYRLSPGVYGTQQQAMNQYNQQMQQFNASLPQQLMKRY